MIYAFIYLLIGSAIAYFMQSHIQWLSERLTTVKFFQIVIKILLDAILGLSWLVTAPALVILKWNLEQEEKEDEKT